MPADWKRVNGRWSPPEGFVPVTQLEHARLGIATREMTRVAEREPHLTPEQVRDEVAAGRMVIPANVNHRAHRLDPMCIGRASLTKINANMGASPVSSGTAEEVEKLAWAERWGADTVMDLSTGGDLDATREAIVRHARVPIGTVPIYSMIIGRAIEELDAEDVLASLEHQARQGVDYFTIHAGILYEHIPYVRDRLIGIVSRGGSLLAKWMLHHKRQNLMYELWDEICAVMRRCDVTFSIGDGLRPGGLSDATDRAQLAELETLGELTERAWANGCQVMIEGPGHMSFDAAYHGASMLCYVTPKEHLGLPKKEDVKQGVIAYKIAAHAADVALGIPGTRDHDDELTKARAALNWEKHFELAYDSDTARAFHDEDLDVDTDFCAMCGHDWCAVRISKEITEFVSGKDRGYAWSLPVVSAALTSEQREILERRGVLSPEEIHRLASKTQHAMGVERGERATCHSNVATSERARTLQKRELDPVTLEPRPESPGV
jgi:phosphomethylpyrimidine synthase